jgi:hypothetical protein
MRFFLARRKTFNQFGHVEKPSARQFGSVIGTLLQVPFHGAASGMIAPAPSITPPVHGRAARRRGAGRFLEGR